MIHMPTCKCLNISDAVAAPAVVASKTASDLVAATLASVPQLAFEGGSGLIVFSFLSSASGC